MDKVEVFTSTTQKGMIIFGGFSLMAVSRSMMHNKLLITHIYIFSAYACITIAIQLYCFY